MLSTRKLLIDLREHNQTHILAYGGQGGRGNDHFKSASNQTPMEAENGQDGEEKYILLEQKMGADIGIIGLPNVGKSSLLKALTRANPKIAGYPFTTLEPNLGVLKMGSGKQDSSDKSKNNLVLVDVPGVVEDAWEGKGIGPWFLRHLERTDLLVHVLAPGTGNGKQETVISQLVDDYVVVRKELEKYGQGLPDKAELVVVNKLELIDLSEREQVQKELEKEIGKEVMMASVGMGEGLDELVEKFK